MTSNCQAKHQTMDARQIPGKTKLAIKFLL